MSGFLTSVIPVPLINKDFWTPERLRNWMLHRGFDKSFITIDKVRGVVSVAIGRLAFDPDYDVFKGQWGYKEAWKESADVMRFGASCNNAGECDTSAQGKAGVGPASVTLDLETGDVSGTVKHPFFNVTGSSSGQGTLFIGPNGKMTSSLSGKAGAELTATLDGAAFMSYVMREYERQTTGYAHFPPNVRDFIDENIVIKIGDDTFMSPSEIFLNESHD